MMPPRAVGTSYMRVANTADELGWTSSLMLGPTPGSSVHESSWLGPYAEAGSAVATQLGPDASAVAGATATPTRV